MYITFFDYIDRKAVVEIEFTLLSKVKDGHTSKKKLSAKKKATPIDSTQWCIEQFCKTTDI